MRPLTCVAPCSSPSRSRASLWWVGAWLALWGYGVGAFAWGRASAAAVAETPACVPLLARCVGALEECVEVAGAGQEMLGRALGVSVVRGEPVVVTVRRPCGGADAAEDLAGR